MTHKTHKTHTATPPSQVILQTPESLREKCKQPFICWPPKDRLELHFRWHDTVAEVQAATKDGCRLCAQLLINRKSLYPSNAPEESDSNVGTLDIHSCSDGTRPEKGILFYVNMYWCEDPATEMYVEREVWQARALLIPYVQQETYLSSTGEEDKLSHSHEQSKRWLRDCNAGHSCLAHIGDTPKELPSRLIALGDGETRLCPDITTIDPSTLYASLSHCWGLKKFLTLVKANFADFIQEIPPKGLTKTFKEAISIAG